MHFVFVGAKIVIDQDNEVGELRTCEVTGTETQIECAKQLIEEKIGEDQAFRAKQKNKSHDNGNNSEFRD